jgi:WD40 repeat protein
MSQESQLGDLKVSLLGDKGRFRHRGSISSSLALLMPEHIMLEEADTTATANLKETSKISLNNDSHSLSLSNFQEALKRINPSRIQLPYQSALLIKLLKTCDIGLYISYSGASPSLIKYCFRTSAELGTLAVDLAHTLKILASPDEQTLFFIKPSGIVIVDLDNMEIFQEASFPEFKIASAAVSLNSMKLYLYTDKRTIVSYDYETSKTKVIFSLGDHKMKHLARDYAFLSIDRELFLYRLSEKEMIKNTTFPSDLKSTLIFVNFDNTLAVFFDPNRLQISVRKLPELEKVVDYIVEDKIAKLFFTAGDKSLIIYYENTKLGVFLLNYKEKPITYATLIQIDKKFFHFNPLNGMFYANDILHDTYRWSFLENSFEALNLKTCGADFLKISNSHLYELEGDKIHVRDLQYMNLVNSYPAPISYAFEIQRYDISKNIALFYKSSTCLHIFDTDSFEPLQEISLEVMSRMKKALSFYSHNQIILLDRNNIRIFDMNSKQIETNVFAAHIHEITNGMVAQSSQLLITTSLDKTVKIWSLINNDCKFVDKMIYNDTEFSCLGVDNAEEYLFAGGKSEVVVWHLHNRHLIINYEFTSQAARFLFTKDNNFFIIAEIYGKITIGHLKTFTKVTEIDMMNTLVDLSLDVNEEYLYVFTKLSTKKYRNPLKTDAVTIYGSVSDTSQYFPYLDDMCVKGKVPPHDPNFDKLIFSPGGITSLHIYVYFGLTKHLKKCLKENIMIIPDRNGQNPLDMCMEMKDTELLGMFLDALIREIPKNKHLATVFEESIVKINHTGHPILDDLYRVLFRVCTDFGVPRFCDDSVKLPVTVHSSKRFIDPKLFAKQENYEAKKQMIAFQEALIPLNFNIGSEESIEFLKSIIECPNSEIFRTPLIREYLLGKWKQARKGMLIQMMLYILYMGSLLFHVVNEHYTIDMWMILSTDCTIMFFEFYQMYLNGKDYWDDVWNYLDVVRALLCKIYVVYLTLDYDKSEARFLTLLLLISFWRGIAYYRLFSDTRYLINLIFEVLSDIRAFMIVLLYTTIAHIVLGYVINRINKEETDWAKDVKGAYGILFGDIENPKDIIQWIVLTINLIVDPIIMLNLLISIIGATYERVEEKNEIADMKEMAEMILEVEIYSTWNRHKSGKYYLQMCTNKEMLDTDLSPEAKLKAIDKKLGSLIQMIKSDKKASQKSSVKQVVSSLFTKDSVMKLIDLSGVDKNKEESKGDMTISRTPTLLGNLGIGGFSRAATKVESPNKKVPGSTEAENSPAKPAGLLGGLGIGGSSRSVTKDDSPIKKLPPSTEAENPPAKPVGLGGLKIGGFSRSMTKDESPNKILPASTEAENPPAKPVGLLSRGLSLAKK